MMRMLLGVAMVAAVALPVRAEDAPTTKTAQKLKLEGKYTFQRGEKAGQAIPAARLQGSQVVITGDEMIGTDSKQNQVFVTKYTLDSTTKPMKLVMKSTIPSVHETTGLLEQRGEELWLIYALPGGEAPTSFTCKEKQQLFVMVRQTNAKGAAEQIEQKAK